MDNIADIDKRIGVLEKELMSLRKRRNQLAAIRRLPTELVVRIFKLLIPTVPENRLEYGEEPYDLDSLSHVFQFSQPHQDSIWVNFDYTWVKLMSTCTWLREIALTARELWYSEGIKLPGKFEWIKLCRTRAGDMPLLLKSQFSLTMGNHLYLNREFETVIALNVLKEHLPEASEAIISLIAVEELDDDIFDQCMNILEQKCPKMQYLNLSWMDLPLDDGFLGGICASLTTLVLSHISEFQSWPQLPSLCNLHLEYQQRHTQIGVEGLLKWLMASPAMEVLHIDCHTASLRFGYFDTQTQPFIKLPFLRILKLQVLVDDCAQLLRMFPNPHIGLDITLTDGAGSLRQEYSEAVTRSYEDMLSRMLRFWYQDNQHQPATDLQVTIKSPIVVDVSKPQTSVSLTYRSFPMDELPDTTRRFCNFVAQQHGHVPLPPIRSIDLHLACTYPGGSWFDTFEDLKLEHMNIGKVVLDIADDYDDIRTQVDRLQRWLTVRKLSERPIEVLQIRSWVSLYEEKLDSVWDLEADVRELQLAKRVEL